MANERHLRELRARLGPSAYAGLEALAECRHADAVTWSRNAAYTDNPDHALAGIWLSAVTYADWGRDEQARALFPEILEADPRVSSEAEAQRQLDAAVLTVEDIRVAYGQPAHC